MDVTVTNDRARKLWVNARLFCWPGHYLLRTIPFSAYKSVTDLLSLSLYEQSRRFFAAVLEKDMLSITVDRAVWQEFAECGAPGCSDHTTADLQQYAVITFDIELEPDVVGFLAPVATMLANAGISIVPQCAYARDHLLVKFDQREQAMNLLQQWIDACAAGSADV